MQDSKLLLSHISGGDSSEVYSSQDLVRVPHFSKGSKGRATAKVVQFVEDDLEKVKRRKTSPNNRTTAIERRQNYSKISANERSDEEQKSNFNKD